MSGNASSIAKVWGVIDATLANLSPKAAAALHKPATSKALASLEKSLGAPLSAELRAYLAIHDGQDIKKKRVPFLFVKTAWMLLPAASIAYAYKELCELEADGEFEGQEGSSEDGLVKPLWWSDQWIPFAVSAGGDYLCVDMGPTKKGKVGQVFWWYHDEDFRDRSCPNLTSFFQDYADALTGGKLTVFPDGSIDQ